MTNAKPIDRSRLDEFWDVFQTRYRCQSNGCWQWAGPHNPQGYGIFQVGKTRHPAHRLAYEFWVGPLSTELTIDHICRNTGCINPDHLRAVSVKENVLAGIGHTAINARKTHCPHGHPYSGDNLKIRANGYRQCRTCFNAYRRKRMAGVRAAILATLKAIEEPSAEEWRSDVISSWNNRLRALTKELTDE